MDDPVPATPDAPAVPATAAEPTSAPATVNAAEPAPAQPTTVNAVAAEPTVPAAPAAVNAAAPQPAPVAMINAAAPAGGDPITAVRKQMVAEMRRLEAIRRICDGKFPQIEAQAIEQGWDEPTTELHVLRASRPRVAAVTAPQRPNSPQVFEAVALMASGMASRTLENLYGAPVLEAADRLRGVGIQEFCEIACGQHLPRFRRDATSWLQAAFSTTSLPGILSNVANKMLLEGYNYVEDAWRQIAKIATVTDFREHSRYRLGGNFRFQQVGPDGELKHGKIDEQRYGQKADTHGIMFALTRQMIINDDLGAFTDIPRQIGMGAAEAIADSVWGLLLSNPTQTDGQAFFSTAHGNYAEGADTALSIDALTAAEVLFGSQVKPNGRPLGMSASILLVPTALKVPAETLMKAASLNETTTANKGKPNVNPHTGKYNVVSSVYLSNASFTGYSSKAWYLLADPNRLPAIEIAFLNGVDSPTVEKTDADFTTLGIQFRGYIDFGVREQDFRAALRMKGEV
jgi:phage major head subunit gpT-like protein